LGQFGRAIGAPFAQADHFAAARPPITLARATCAMEKNVKKLAFAMLGGMLLLGPAATGKGAPTTVDHQGAAQRHHHQFFCKGQNLTA
jgi:hypothetical protein